MTDLLCAPDYTPEPGLTPIPQAMSPFEVGERIAFREDHEIHGAESFEGEWADEEAPKAARYGLIRAIGVNENGLALDVLVLDPATGLPLEGEPIHRASMEEIQ